MRRDPLDSGRRSARNVAPRLFAARTLAARTQASRTLAAPTLATRALTAAASLAALGLAAAAGCGPSGPYCSEGLEDATGRAVAFCPGPRDEPVCDYPDDMARFEDGAMGVTLVGGEHARCDAEREVACPPDTVGEPYCITDPEL